VPFERPTPATVTATTGAPRRRRRVGRSALGVEAYHTLDVRDRPQSAAVHDAGVDDRAGADVAAALSWVAARKRGGCGSLSGLVYM
jgi:hypothetical protein